MVMRPARQSFMLVAVPPQEVRYYVLCHVCAGDDRPQRSCSLGMWADFLVLLQLYTAAVSAAVYCTVSYLCAPKIASVNIWTMMILSAGNGISG